MTDFLGELRALINKHSKENGSNTADWILAEFLSACLVAFDAGINKREAWYGIQCSPGKDMGPK